MITLYAKDIWVIIYEGPIHPNGSYLVFLPYWLEYYAASWKSLQYHSYLGLPQTFSELLEEQEFLSTRQW